MSKIKDREKIYQQSKQHLQDIQDGKIPPDKVKIDKKSIYAEWLEKNESNLVPAMEKEIYRNITTFSPKVATKRIMELIWITRYEW